MVDLDMLISSISSSGLKRTYIAKRLGISRASLWMKLAGKTEISAKQMCVLKDLLNLSDTLFRRIFFATESELNSHSSPQEVT